VRGFIAALAAPSQARMQAWGRAGKQRRRKGARSGFVFAGEKGDVAVRVQTLFVGKETNGPTPFAGLKGSCALSYWRSGHLAAQSGCSYRAASWSSSDRRAGVQRGVRSGSPFCGPLALRRRLMRRGRFGDHRLGVHGSSVPRIGPAPGNPQHPPCPHRGVLAGGPPAPVVARWWRLRAQALFALRWLLPRLVGAEEVTLADHGARPRVGRRTQVPPARYCSRARTPALALSSRIVSGGYAPEGAHLRLRRETPALQPVWWRQRLRKNVPR
jgi:hypothetical protein